MKKKNSRIIIPALLVCAVLIFLVILAWSRTGSVPAGQTTEILAEKLSADTLQPGDRIIITVDAGRQAVALTQKNHGLDGVDIEVKHTKSREVLCVLPEDTAVFDILDAGSGAIYLQSSAGYLTASDEETSLYYKTEPVPASRWHVRDGCFLQSAVSSSDDESVSGDLWLEYYPDFRYFMVHNRDDQSDPSYYTMSFFRLGSSLADEAVLDDSLYVLPVFETSDIHGHLADHTKDGVLYLLAAISDKVRDVRGTGTDERKDLAVLLDGGDIWQGTALTSFLGLSPLSAAFDCMAYDAVAVGNHEFDFGLDQVVDPDSTMTDYDIGSFSDENTIPVLCADLYQNGNKLSFYGDYIILEKTARDSEGRELPVRIAVIGYASKYGKSIRSDLFLDKGYDIRTDYDAVNTLARSLEDSGKCDATIFLVHGNPSDSGEKLGDDTPIDLILGGHDHLFISWTASSGVPVLDPGRYGQGYAYAELGFSVSDGKPVFEKVSSARVNILTDEKQTLLNLPENEEELDPELLKLTDEVLAQMNPILNQEIGWITESAKRRTYLPDSGKRASVFGQWMASIEARAVGADVGFINNGGMRVDLPVEEGETRRIITLEDIYNMFPFDNRIFCFELTYGELLEVLDYALTYQGSIILSQMSGLDCWYKDGTVNALVTSEGEVIYRKGQWKDGWKDKTLKVALNEYCATTQRKEGDLGNPFIQWKDTSRLVDTSVIDREGAVSVLTREADANNGLLTLDDQPHMINLDYNTSH